MTYYDPDQEKGFEDAFDRETVRFMVRLFAIGGQLWHSVDGSCRVAEDVALLVQPAPCRLAIESCTRPPPAYSSISLLALYLKLLRP